MEVLMLFMAFLIILVAVLILLIEVLTLLMIFLILMIYINSIIIKYDAICGFFQYVGHRVYYVQDVLLTDFMHKIDDEQCKDT